MISIFRRLKASYLLNNLLHAKALKCNEEVYKKYGLHQSVLQFINHKKLKQLPQIDTPWLDNNKITNAEIRIHKDFEKFDDEVKENILQWQQNGYMVLKNIYTNAECDIINSEIDRLNQLHKAKHRFDERIIFAIHQSKQVYNLATKQSVLDILNFILGKKVRLFQSLNFLHGSSQKAHSDTIHMTTHPLGYMIAVWIALEDISADSGPLFYYPGSHKLPYVLNDNYQHGGNYFLLGKNAYPKYEEAIQEVIDKNNLQKKILLANKGDILIWHANLLHGGSPIINPALTRKSMVLHFYTEDVICYHEITNRPAIFGGKEAHCP